MCRVTTAVGDSATCAVPAIAQCDTIRPLFENTTANTWTTKSPLSNVGRNASVGFSIGNRGYIATGNIQNSNGLLINSNQLWEYNPFLNSWTQKANYPGGKIWDGVGFSIGNKGYVGTGFDPAVGNSNAFYEYDPITNSWTQKTNFPYAPTGAVGFSVGNKGYVGLGLDNGFMASIYEFDPVTNSWTSKANYPGVGTFAAAAFSIGSKGYVGTGAANNGDNKDFYEFNPSAATGSQWTRIPDFPGTARNNAVGFSIGNKGYIGTGSNTADFWEYDPITNNWTSKAAGYACTSAAAFAVHVLATGSYS
jgi:hypothetical protein